MRCLACIEAARSSPHLEVFRRKEIEVLVLADRVDEWMLSFLDEFDGKALVSVARGGLDLGGLQDAEEKQKVEQTAKAYAELVGRIKAALRAKDKVEELRLANELGGKFRAQYLRAAELARAGK